MNITVKESSSPVTVEDWTKHDKSFYMEFGTDISVIHQDDSKHIRIIQSNETDSPFESEKTVDTLTYNGKPVKAVSVSVQATASGSWLYVYAEDGIRLFSTGDGVNWQVTNRRTAFNQDNVHHMKS